MQWHAFPLYPFFMGIRDFFQIRPLYEFLTIPVDPNDTVLQKARTSFWSMLWENSKFTAFAFLCSFLFNAVLYPYLGNVGGFLGSLLNGCILILHLVALVCVSHCVAFSTLRFPLDYSILSHSSRT
jgi:hypothetical protein